MLAARPFRDRVRELEALHRVWDARGAQFLVVWGRRRVGKTALLREGVRGRHHVFLVADTQREALLLEMFASECARTLGPPGLGFRSWDAFFEYLSGAAARETLIVVLDEVGFLQEANPAFFSILQRQWDTSLSRTRIRLVLCGSSVSAMERQVLGYRSPLYGRRTGQLEVHPLGYAEAREFFPRALEDRRVEFYAVLGGVPAYLLQFDPSKDGRTNVEERVFPPESYLHREPRLLLLQELRQPATYFSVLTAIAGGTTRFNEISQRSGLTPNTLGKYLGVLQELRLVRRELPATEARPTRRRSQYRIADPFFAFWFRFVAPWAGSLEAAHTEVPRRRLFEDWDAHVGTVFEEVCRELVRDRPEVFGGPWERVGRWWSGETEIDVAALDRRRSVLLLGECKWSTRRVEARVLDDLREKGGHVGGRWRQMRFALFSRAGFTPGCIRQAGEGALLLDLNRIRRLFEVRPDGETGGRLPGQRRGRS